MKNKRIIDFDFMSKVRGLALATSLGGRMPKISDEDMSDILWKPYSFERFEEADIRMRFEMMVP